MNYKNIYGRRLRSELGGRFQPFCRTLINPREKIWKVNPIGFRYQNFQQGLLYKISSVKFYMSR